MEVVPLLECGSQVVQLSVSGTRLLISTLARSLLMDASSGRLTQVRSFLSDVTQPTSFYHDSFNSSFPLPSRLVPRRGGLGCLVAPSRPREVKPTSHDPASGYGRPTRKER